MSPILHGKIAVVVPLYYCDKSLFRIIQLCFNSIADSFLGLDHRKLTIDDASPLPYPEIWNITEVNKTNQGFTKTVNKGLEIAFSRKETEIVVVCNDDIIMTKECAQAFANLDSDKAVIASPRDTSSSDDDKFGACWGMTREAYDLLGPLNERYKHFYSDVDYYTRAKASGVEIIKWTDITLAHPESSTYKTLDKETLLNEDRERYYSS